MWMHKMFSGATIRNKYRVTLVHYGANDWKIDTVQMY